MYAIPITPFTLDLIRVLNGGVRPLMEAEPTVFCFDPKDESAYIITQSKFEATTNDRNFVTLSYFVP